MPVEDDRKQGAPQSVGRVIHILEALCRSAGPVSLADLSRRLGAPKSSLSALLRGLSESGFVVGANGAYRLGPAAFGLGSALVEARRRFQSSDLIRDGMRRLAERTGETVLFAVRDQEGASLTYVDVIESANPVRFSVAVGDRRPLYCTSGGRMLLAAGPEEEARRYFKALKPQSLTLHTETDKRKLAEAVAIARERGVAQTMSQTAEGVNGTAAAIRDSGGHVIGALIVAAPSTRRPARASEMAELVRDEAAAISRSLGERAPPF